MQNPNSKNLSVFIKEGETAMQVIAEKINGQVGPLLFDSLEELLGLMKENGKPPPVQQMHRPDEFLTAIEMGRILKINKTKAYQLIRTRQMSSQA